MSNAVNLSALGSNGGTSVSTWTTGTRPASPLTGQTGFNTTLGSLESYNGSAWVSGGGLNIQSVQTTGFTAVAGNIYPCNTTSAAFTVTLPASPTAGNQIAIIDYAGTFNTNNLTINPNSLKINGATNSAKLAVKYFSVIMVYVDVTRGWTTLSSSAATTGNPLTQTYTATYLVVAGGGGGGDNSGGGGGAGGLLTSTATLNPGSVYTITVGAGGAASFSQLQGSDGANSVLSGSGITTVTSIGGGGAGSLNYPPGSWNAPNGRSGGSGGGGGAGFGGYAGGTGGAATSGQGFAGGAGATGLAAAGGGGSSAIGSNAVASGSGGAGGAGTASSITGSSVTYAGGGGGGGAPAGAGGSGGGGGGSTNGGSNGAAGTANTGGGGGGNGNGASTGPFSGGSGVVILSVPTTNYTGTTTGSPTVTTSGANTVIKFTASGTYTA